jgi:hypothetical protein
VYRPGVGYALRRLFKYRLRRVDSSRRTAALAHEKCEHHTKNRDEGSANATDDGTGHCAGARFAERCGEGRCGRGGIEVPDLIGRSDVNVERPDQELPAIDELGM